MPRKSTASRETPSAAPNIDVSRNLLQPREGCEPAIAAVFSEVVASVAPGHFTRSDAPILEEFAVAIYIARTARAKLSTVDLASTAGARLARLLRDQGRTVATLATRLRCTPHSRISKERAGKTTQPAAATFWS